MRTFQTNCRKWLLGLVCLWLAGVLGMAAESRSAVREYELKAVFLYNFIKFTDWPTNAFASTNAPIVIGIVGEDPFGQTIDDVVRVEVVGGRPLRIKRLSPGGDYSGCHVLFISRAEKDRSDVLTRVQGLPVLTMSDAPEFAEQGGMVTLLLVNKMVKPEINQAVAEASGLRISAKLLMLARLVKSK